MTSFATHESNRTQDSPNPIPGREIGNHAVIGNLSTTALVAHDGTIDFLCWPNTDSPTIFASLLDPEGGGGFEIVPHLENARTMQTYVPQTNVVMTRWLAEAASLEVVDLMPHPEIPNVNPGQLIRRVRATRGDVTISVRIRPRFDYAREIPTIAAVEGGVIFSGSSLRLRLSTPIAVAVRPGEACGTFTLRRGETTWFVLVDANEKPTPAAAMESIVAQTCAAWRSWIANSTYKGRWRDYVDRSALAMKLLTSYQHGSIAAAATFGLPEAAGASRNWDYRATWMRDAAFTVYAFLRLGFVAEAEHFREYLGDRIRIPDGGRLHIMYAIDGSEAADEMILEHLAGYGGSRPVRTGNAARRQIQFDIFGELIDSLYLTTKYGRGVTRGGWDRFKPVIEDVIDNWQCADSGIWEIRDSPREFTHSRLMCWVAIDRAIRLAYKQSLPAPISEWMHARDQIADAIWNECRHPEKGHFVQSRGARTVDASLLMMPLMRFVSSTDPVWKATMDAIENELSDDGLIFRYRNADGLQGREGAFTPCLFWWIECLARAGRLEEAELCMETAIGYANHVGLFSEELDARGFQMGNFPQALTHLALISAAYYLDRALSQRSQGVWQP